MSRDPRLTGFAGQDGTLHVTPDTQRIRGQYMVNGPPHFRESTLFPREPGKNGKVCTFSKDGTLCINGKLLNCV
uniref:Uncharacterized protein n=1 Tax=Canis lupus familiaris TaxID=9615 RepID=A0A8I3QSS0_CANLF